MTKQELTKMKAWLVEHVEDYLVYTPVGNIIANADLGEDFYDHFKTEIRN